MAGFSAAVLLMTSLTGAAEAEGRGGKDVAGAELLRYPTRPEPQPLPPPSTPMQWIDSERIALVGNSLGERENLFGHIETQLQLSNSDKQLVVRNFARSADEVGQRQRPSSYTDLDDPLAAFGPDTVLCFFGFNEAFNGPKDVTAFRANYDRFLADFAREYSRGEGADAVRFILVGPAAYEDPADPLRPDGSEINNSLRAYSDAIKELAAERKLPFIDLLDVTGRRFASEEGLQWTQNGYFLNDAGYQLVAETIGRQLNGEAQAVDAQGYEAVRQAVLEKNWVHLQDYRMLNGWYVYGQRRTWDTETFPREFNMIRFMAAARDQAIWALAGGREPPKFDDARYNDLIVPPTRFGDPRQDYSEPEELRYNTPQEFIATAQVPEGMKVEVFADEQQFPELAKPVQLCFDSRGRLWVSCMPTYPQWQPGDGRPDDRLLILEDTDGDGRADKCTTFADDLHCPTGFELYKDGVIVTDQPRLVYLRDTDGDDVADTKIDLMDGWGTDDTHHTIGAFEISPGGLLYMLEGVSMTTSLETPWGPRRWRGAAGAYMLDPQTLKVSRFTTPGYGNPWCMVFDDWGQPIVGDGTNAQQHWATGLNGAQEGPRRGLDPIFDNKGMRPAVGSEFLVSRHLPDDLQGQFIYACVINMNGMPRFTVREDGAAFSGERVEDLLASSDKNFRPVDPQVGPDGAIWFGDWCNALIGHMQYSQRDPNRDHYRGRIYRLVNTKKPLLEPTLQAGKSELELLEQLREPEPRTHYRVRRELQSRDAEQVVAALAQFVAGLKADDPLHDKLLTEAAWALQRHHRVDRELIKRLMEAKDHRARTAAVRLVSEMEEHFDKSVEFYATAIEDSHPQVRAEAVRALSFHKTMPAFRTLLAATQHPTDKWIDYLLEHAIGATQDVWEKEYENQTLDLPQPAMAAVEKFMASARPGLAAAPYLKTLIQETEVRAQVRRNNAYAALEKMRGNSKNGAAVFGRVCANCHKIGESGYDFGPNLSDAGRRLSRHDLIESIIEPSAKMDKKYQTEILQLDSDEVINGFIAEENDDHIVLSMPEGKTRIVSQDEIVGRKTALQSSMPENLAATIAASEFLDLIEYLASQK